GLPEELAIGQAAAARRARRLLARADAVDRRDDLLGPLDGHEDRRPVGRGAAIPLPSLLTVGQTQGDDFAGLVIAEADDGHAVDDERRRRGVEHRVLLRVLLPDEAAARRVEAAEHAADAEGYDLAIGYRGGAAWPGMNPARRLGRLLRLVS